jgi:hypothetical protein
MTSYIRHLAISNPATAFPVLERRSIAAHLVNLQLAIGADSGSIGAPIQLIAVRFFSAGAQYALNDLVVQAGVIYRAKGTIPPGTFNATQWQVMDNTGSMLIDGSRAMTGNLTISKDNPRLLLDKTGNVGAHVVGQKSGLDRWIVALGNGTVESGANVGSDFTLTRCSDAGAAIDNPLFISRADGRVTLLADPTATLHAATKGYVDTKVAGIGGYLPLTGGTLSGDLIINKYIPQIVLDRTSPIDNAVLRGKKNGVERWAIALADSDAEAGGNTGSSFRIYSFADNGAYITIPLSIDRATGRISIAADPVNDMEVATKRYADAGGLDKVKKSGDTMTGNLLITRDATDARVTLNVQGVGAWPVLAASRNGLARWQHSFGEDNFGVQRFNDAGGHTGTPLYINRTSGVATFEQAINSPGGFYTAGSDHTIRWNWTGNIEASVDGTTWQGIFTNLNFPATTNYMRHPNGEMFVWGETGPGPGSDFVVNFPVAFPGYCGGVIVTAAANVGLELLSGHVLARSNTSFSLGPRYVTTGGVGTATQSFYYFAWGW